MTRIFVLAALTAGALSIPAPQRQLLHLPQGPLFRTSIDTVRVTVTVTRGREFVAALPPDAFHLFEDGQPQTITTFASEKIPIDLVVAVDASGSMVDSMPKLKIAAARFLQAIPSDAQVTLLAFSNTVVTLAQNATDPVARVAPLDQLKAWGATVLYDAMKRGIETLRGRPGRQALVVFTDGEDQGSDYRRQEIEEFLQESDVTVYMIAQGQGLSTGSLRQTMQRLADPTGGRVFFTADINRLQGAFDELLEELSNQYLLGYESTNRAKDGKWRELRVTIDEPGTVRARQGYRATAPLR